MSYTKLTDFAAKDALLSGNPSKLLRGTEIGAEFDAIESAMAVAEAVNITAPIIAASTSKTAPVNADVLPILDSAAANILKKVTWANIKATLKTYFDTLYAAVGAFAASGANADITSLTGLTSPIPSANTVGKIESLPNPTLSGNAMTLPASTHALDFRSATLSSGLATTVSGTAAALVIPAGATLGTVSAVQSTIVEVILNNSGTLEKAVVNLAGGNDLSETGVISTTAISSGATAANVLYSNTARTNVPYRVVRTITSTQATAGQWATSPSAIQGAGGNAMTSMQSLGYGQTWQGVTRISGTTYYNTTGKPITLRLHATGVAVGLSYVTCTVNGIGVNMAVGGHVSFATNDSDQITIPVGARYVLTEVNTFINTAYELR